MQALTDLKDFLIYSIHTQLLDYVEKADAKKRSLVLNNSEIRLLKTLTWNTSLNNRNSGFTAHCCNICYQCHCKIITATKGPIFSIFVTGRQKLRVADNWHEHTVSSPAFHMYLCAWWVSSLWRTFKVLWVTGGSPKQVSVSCFFVPHQQSTIEFLSCFYPYSQHN